MDAPSDSTAAAHSSPYPVPAVDSINAWTSLLVPNVSTNASIALGGRGEVVLSYCLEVHQCYPTYPGAAHGYPLAVGDAALVVGEYKIVWGKQAGQCEWSWEPRGRWGDKRLDWKGTQCRSLCLFVDKQIC